MIQKKILLKMVDDIKGTGKLKWVHFCYVPEEVYNRFFKRKRKDLFNEDIEKWAKEDFNIELSMKLCSHRNKLLQHIILTYKRKYSELFYVDWNNGIKSSKWLNLWVSKHMIKEVNDILIGE